MTETLPSPCSVASGCSFGCQCSRLSSLKTGPADFAYEVEVALTAPRMDETAIAGASAIGAALRAAGFANDAASVSLQNGDGQTIALTVRLRPNARLDSTGRPEGQP